MGNQQGLALAAGEGCSPEHAGPQARHGRQVDLRGEAARRSVDQGYDFGDVSTDRAVQAIDFDFDLMAFSAWASGHRELAPLVMRFAGFRPSLSPDPFEALVTSITAQQVSLHAAVAIRNRFVERLGEPVGRAWAFPGRERVALTSEEELVALGFSRRKAEYVVGLARSEIDLGGLALLPDEEVKERIVAIRGLGEWTADWFLARHLGRPHAWPAGDLALRKAVRALYGDVDVREAGARFKPFQNLTAHYLLAQFLNP